MAIDMTPEQRAVGEANFQKAVDHLGLNRRDFLKAGIVGAGAVGGSAAAVYFGYQSMQGRPVKAALIGGGDEGGVLAGEHNPEFLEIVAVSDIRPYNIRRIMDGDPKVALRKGLRKIYGEKARAIRQYTDWRQILDDKDIEAVIIALPLHLHAPVAIECMKAGKHVLCEKLMARSIGQCKEMIRVARETKRVLSIGHQRHYSMLYAHAQEVIKSGILGDIKHIRALWHRNFSWPASFNSKEFEWAFDGNLQLAAEEEGVTKPKFRDGWFQPVLKGDVEGIKAFAKEKGVDLKKYLADCGYDSVEQLVRWRLYEKTGGGLMAELGSHQLDAASIFLGKVKPLSVSGVGTRSFFGPGRNDREIDDHVYVTYEFPGKNYASDRNDIVVVTYSSISTNGFEQYGECLMGTRGTMVVEAEQRVMLYTEKDPTKKGGDAKMMTVDVATMPKGQAAADASSTWGGPSASVTAARAGTAAPGGPISRGYREEMEDFAYCVRTWDPKLGYDKDRDGKFQQRLPRCHGEVAMADAIIALTANMAMKGRSRIVFDEKWFDADSPEVPEKA
ncbi:MAG: Gfo/Idh/MocA family oxidoreductase [Gemmataceae bacterium]